MKSISFFILPVTAEERYLDFVRHFRAQTLRN
jgi:hypothetical protein